MTKDKNALTEYNYGGVISICFLFFFADCIFARRMVFFPLATFVVLQIIFHMALFGLTFKYPRLNYKALVIFLSGILGTLV